MSKYRNENYTQISGLLKALSNEHRLRIFVRLVQCCTPGTLCDVKANITPCVSQLGEDLNIVPSTLSHHMKELRQAGLIKMQRDGQKMQCWVEPEMLALLNDFFAELDSQNCAE